MTIGEDVERWVGRLVRADQERLEFDCGEALELTAPGMRHRLVIVTGPFDYPTLGFVACMTEQG